MVTASTGAGPQTTSGGLRQQRRPATDHRGRHCRRELDCAFGSFCCVTESKFGGKHIRPNWSTLAGGSIWPPGALREAPAWRKLSDPIPPSTPCSGADGGTTSSCGKDSSFSTAVTGNLMGPEMSDSRATPSGSTSLCVSDTTLVLHALDRVK